MSETIPAMMSLPARYYMDPDYYRAELEWFFFGMWVYAGRADEIPNRGDFVLREIAGESVILVRGERGEIAAFYNVCRHRGTRLCERPTGTFASTIQCPYHAWTYDLSGGLVAAPQMDRIAGFREADYPLHRVAVDLWDGHVFLNLAAEPGAARGPAPRAGRAVPSLADGRAPAGQAGRLRRRGQLEADHPQLLGVPPLPGSAPGARRNSRIISAARTSRRPTATWAAAWGCARGSRTLSLDGRHRRACLPGLGEEECRYVYFYAVLPNLLLSLHPDYVMTHALWPRGVGRTEIVCEWLFHPDAMAAADFDPEDAVAFWDMTNRQDWHVCEQMQLGLGSRAYRPGPYSHREDLLPQFDQIILEFERAMGPIRARSASE